MVKDELECADFTVLGRKEIAARIRFFTRRHFLPIYISISTLFAFLTSLLLVSNMRGTDSTNQHLLIIQFALGLLIFFVGAAPLISSLSRTARKSDMAAALRAADHYERPMLRARLEARLKSPVRSGPLTTDELTKIFNSVRAIYGKRARRITVSYKAAMATQRDFLERLRSS